MPKPRAASEPMFNVPLVIVALVGAMIAIHVLRAFVLSPEADEHLLELFAFVPLRLDQQAAADFGLAGGTPALIWTFLSYGLLHGDFTHLGVNMLWLVAFGTPLARRFSTIRFLVFIVACTAAGAGAHLASHVGAGVPMIGASAAVAGCMAAAARFMFVGRRGARGAGIQAEGVDHGRILHAPAAPIRALLSDRRFLGFVAVWLVVNLLAALAPEMVGGSGAIAWQAHIGGFFAGLVLFPLLDGATPIDHGDDVGESSVAEPAELSED